MQENSARKLEPHSNYRRTPEVKVNDPAFHTGGDMQEDLVKKIKSHPTYHELVSKRSRFGWWLSAMMLVVYYGYILLIAFNKEFLSRKIGDGVMTLGIPIGLFVIVFTIVITGIYVRRANSEFDEMTAALRKEVGA